MKLRNVIRWYFYCYCTIIIVITYYIITLTIYLQIWHNEKLREQISLITWWQPVCTSCKMPGSWRGSSDPQGMGGDFIWNPLNVMHKQVNNIQYTLLPSSWNVQDGKPIKVWASLGRFWSLSSEFHTLLALIPHSKGHAVPTFHRLLNGLIQSKKIQSMSLTSTQDIFLHERNTCFLINISQVATYGGTFQPY